jgi:hypothetical protein
MGSSLFFKCHKNQSESPRIAKVRSAAGLGIGQAALLLLQGAQEKG